MNDRDFVARIADYLEQAGMRKPKAHDWGNAIRVMTHPEKPSCRTIGTLVMLAQGQYPDGIPEVV